MMFARCGDTRVPVGEMVQRKRLAQLRAYGGNRAYNMPKGSEPCSSYRRRRSPRCTPLKVMRSGLSR
jgi:hypothetical protein